LLDEGELAGDTLPSDVEFDPGVGEAAAARIGLAFVDASLAIHDDGAIAEAVSGLLFVGDLLGMKIGGSGGGEEFLFGHDAAVVVNVNELRREKLIERGHVLAPLGVIPAVSSARMMVSSLLRELALEREEQRKKSKEIDQQRRGIS
jgi:hypothetical protein